MSNRALTADIIAKEALAILDNELGWLGKIHRAYEEEFSEKVNGYKKGDTISIRRPVDLTVTDGAVMNLQDVIDANTSELLGETVFQKFGKDLPFLPKVLSIAKALPLQLHPVWLISLEGEDC